MIRIQKWIPFKFVIVITIMGILIAFILPQFTRLIRGSKISLVQGMAGNLRSAITITHGKYLINGKNPVDLDGASINLDDNGYPKADGTPKGILGTLNGTITSTDNYATGTIGSLNFSVGTDTVTLYPTNASDKSTCNVTYTNDISNNIFGDVSSITSGC